VSPSGSGAFCRSIFDILRSATFLNGSFSRQTIDFLHEGLSVNNEFGSALAKKGIDLDRMMKT
jgi:hypothetical protein